MSLLKIVAHSIVSAYDLITATWADISLASPTTSGTNTDVALTFTLGGSTRSINIAYNGVGVLSYRINSGSWVAASTGPMGTTISITTADTLGFKYDNTDDINEARTVTVQDRTSGATVDTFAVDYSGGIDGGIGGDDGTGGGEEGGGEVPD